MPVIQRRRPAALLLASLLLTGLVACSEDEEKPKVTARTGEGWTVLHYSMADTDLEPFMVADVNEMGTVGSRGGLQLRTFMDRSAEYGDDKLLDQGAWSGAKVLDIGQGKAVVDEDLGEVDSADPAVLASFIEQGIRENPAQKYALIVSDHGASWPGMGPDEGADNNVLDLGELVGGVSEGLKKAGLDKFDLIGFDACLMANYEVASAVAPLSDRMVASQELEPGHGWDYSSLKVLADNPGATADEFGAAILKGFAQQAKEQGTQASITLSLLDLSKMGAVDDAVKNFAGALAERADVVSPVVGRAAAQTLGFARSPDASQDAHLKDLGLLAAAIGAEALDVSDQADALIRAVNDVQLQEVFGSTTKGASGLSVYFPPTQDLAAAAYRDVPSAKVWADYLARYYQAGADLPEAEQADFADGDADVVFEDGGVTVSGTYDSAGQANLVEATISYALIEKDGSLSYFGEEFADVDPDGKPVASGFYDLTQLVISDGEDEAVAYLELKRGDRDGLYTVDVPMAYYAPGDENGETYQDVLLSLVLNEDGDVVSEIYYAYDPEAETYGELTADPEGIIVPQVLNLAADGTQEWTATSDAGLFADLENLQYDLRALDPGTKLRLELSVTDIGGNTSTVGSNVVVR